jgi:hypothetical protein
LHSTNAESVDADESAIGNVISDLSGVTGQAIVRAIVAGERNPQKLAELSHPRIEASREEVAKSLEGNGRPELVFVLRQEVEMHDTYQWRITECDQQLQKHLASFANTVSPQSPEAEPRGKKKANKECSTLQSRQRTAAYHGTRPDAHRRHRRDGSPDASE